MFKLIDMLRNLAEIVPNFVICFVLAVCSGLALCGARAYGGAVMAQLWSSLHVGVFGTGRG